MIRFRCSNWLAKRLFASAVAQDHRTHYEVLGLSSHATVREIKSAYFELSKIHHPDKVGGNSEHFRLISNAYQVLSDANARKLYDHSIVDRTRNVRPQPRTTTTNDYSHDQYKSTGSRPRETYGTRQSSGSNFTDANYASFFNQNEWTRAHYSNMFREQHFTARSNRMKNASRREAVHTLSPGLLVFALILMGWFLHYATMLSRIRDQELDRQHMLSKRRF